MQPFPVTIDTAPPKDSERNLFVSSWRHSLQDNPYYGQLPSRAYKLWFDEIAATYLGADESRVTLPADCHLVTVRREDRPSFICAWMLVQISQEGAVVHYIFTKKDFRNNKYARLLLATALELSGSQKLFYTLHVRKWVEPKLSKYQISYTEIDRCVAALAA